MKKPSQENLECADVIMQRHRLDAGAWPLLRRDIALTIDLAEESIWDKAIAAAKGERPARGDLTAQRQIILALENAKRA